MKKRRLMWVKDQECSLLSSTLEVAGVPRGVEGGVAGVSSTTLLLLLRVGVVVGRGAPGWRCGGVSPLLLHLSLLQFQPQLLSPTPEGGRGSGQGMSH